MDNSRNNGPNIEVEVLYQGSPVQENVSGNNYSSGIYPANDSIYPPSYQEIPGVVPLGTGLEHPPTYDEANDPNVPPPTYESLFGRVRQAHRESNGFLEFLKKLLLLIIGTVSCTIILGITMVIPITSIVIGSLHVHDCPAQQYIPIFLIVGGVFGVLKNLMDFRLRCKAKEEVLKQDPISNVVTCFMLAWFIAGCVWVYQVYEPDYNDPDDSDYCHPTLYLYTFWLLNSVLIFVGLIMSCLCCVGCLSMGLSNET